MAGPNNAEFGAQLADILGLVDPDRQALIDLVVAWNGGQFSRQVLAERMSIFETLVSSRDADIDAWLNGTVDGGPNGDGIYPVRIRGGGIVYLWSPAKMRAGTAKGDPARNDIAFSVQWTMGAKEIVAGYVAAFGSTFAPASSKAICRRAPTAQAVIGIKKNMPFDHADPATWPNWGTITFAAGQTNGVFVIPAPTLVTNDYLDFVAPSIQDPTFSDVRVTLAGG